MSNDVLIVQNSEGKRLGIAGGNYRIIVSGKETSGNYAVIEMIVPPGGGPPPHSHPDTQEMFHVLEGEVEFKTEKGSAIVGKDGFVNIPFGGAIHCFKNKSSSVARLLCTVVPAGLETMFEEIGVPVKQGEFPPVPPMTDERKKFMLELSEKYGQKTFPPDFLDK
ncbi:MAG: cupin domain-containing protein [Chitinophagaceae bacterium]|nr:MAG: cupin domain-containing protein [Chitinophagaceae bacterium]